MEVKEVTMVMADLRDKTLILGKVTGGVPYYEQPKTTVDYGNSTYFEEPKLCPILQAGKMADGHKSADCLKERCAWWSIASRCCVVAKENHLGTF